MGCMHGSGCVVQKEGCKSRLDPLSTHRGVTAAVAAYIEDRGGMKLFTLEGGAPAAAGRGVPGKPESMPNGRSSLHGLAGHLHAHRLPPSVYSAPTAQMRWTTATRTPCALRLRGMPHATHALASSRAAPHLTTGSTAPPPRSQAQTPLTLEGGGVGRRGQWEVAGRVV